MAVVYLSPDNIRQAVIERARSYCALTGMSQTALGVAALNDGCAIPDIIGGRDFKLSTYRKIMAWFDEHWPQETHSPSLAENLAKENG